MPSSETNLKNKCLRWLKANRPQAFVWKVSDRFKSGLPDLYLIDKGKHLWIELKRPDGETTRIQDYIITLMIDAGAKVYVVRALSDFKNIVEGGIKI